LECPIGLCIRGWPHWHTGNDKRIGARLDVTSFLGKLSQRGSRCPVEMPSRDAQSRWTVGAAFSGSRAKSRKVARSVGDRVAGAVGWAEGPRGAGEEGGDRGGSRRRGVRRILGRRSDCRSACERCGTFYSKIARARLEKTRVLKEIV
jgi:hypothetical protein